MSARFECFASKEYIAQHFQELLTSKEMEFLYRLQAGEPLLGSTGRVSFDTPRPWMKQQRRTLDISNLGRQDETWTFEIDWSTIQDIAKDCGLGRFKAGERVPFPLLMIRRYVATDYTCDADSNDTSMYMTHRGANNAFAALMATYFLAAHYAIGKNGDLPILELAETYMGWDSIFSLGGNLPSESQKGQREKTVNNADAFFWHLADTYFISHRIVREWRKAADDWKNPSERNDIIDNTNKYFRERYGKDRSTPHGQKDIQDVQDSERKEKEFRDLLNDPDGPLRGHPCTHAEDTEFTTSGTDPKELDNTIATIVQYKALVRKLIDQYPVLVFIPAQESGRRTYQFHLSRYEQRFTVRRALDEINASKDDAPTGAKKLNLMRQFRALLLFREFGQPFQWLRSSTFLVHRFAKDVRPTLVQDTYYGDEQSIVSDTELYTSLHHIPLQSSGGQTSVPDGVTDSEYVSGLLIPRFRYVIPMLTFFAIQVTLLVVYGWLTKFGLQPATSGATKLADDILFRTLVFAQLGVTFFIAPRDESSTATRMLRIPRYTALVLLPFQLWMLNVPYGASLSQPIRSSGVVGWVFSHLFSHPWVFGVGAAALPLLALFLRTVKSFSTRLRKRVTLTVLLSIALICGILATYGEHGPVILPFIGAVALCLMLGIWLIAYLYLRFIAPQNLPPRRPQV